MFTGIIGALGRVKSFNNHGTDRTLSFDLPYPDVILGESIAINGVCLTVATLVGIETGVAVEFLVSPETLTRTNLRTVKAGDWVNVERAMRPSDRLSGHMVQGHVDGLATIKSIREIGDCHELDVELPQTALPYVVEKGSVALDGISLTINSIKNSNIYLMIIPHTWANTNLNSKQIGQNLNLELDVIAKYVERQLNAYNSRGH